MLLSGSTGWARGGGKNEWGEEGCVRDGLVGV